jgi:dihydroorotate dehydrogenase electron transfer subunit
VSEPGSLAHPEVESHGRIGTHRVRAEIVESAPLPGNHHRLVIAAEPIASAAEPGQFVHVWCHSPEDLDRPPSAALLRRPYSISRLRPPDGVEILLRVRGTGGCILAGKKAGEVLDVIGPLGTGFQIPRSLRTAVVAAGGIGLAPAPFLVERLVSQSVQVLLLVGAAEDKALPYRVARTGSGPATIRELAGLGGEVTFVSEAEDGKIVSQLVEELLPRLRPEHDVVMAVGPRAMLKHLAAVIGSRVPLQVSLEERMACGLGACRSCVVPAAGGVGYVTVCHDGPVFDASEIDWERLTP